MKKNVSYANLTWGITAVMVLAIALLLENGASYKADTTGAESNQAPSYATCRRYQRWINAGTLTDNTTDLDYADDIEQCRELYPKTMKVGVSAETCDRYKHLTRAEKRRIPRRSYTEIKAVCKKQALNHRETATVIDAETCLRYRTWELAETLTRNSTDYATVVNACRKEFRSIMQDPEEQAE